MALPESLVLWRRVAWLEVAGQPFWRELRGSLLQPVLLWLGGIRQLPKALTARQRRPGSLRQLALFRTERRSRYCLLLMQWILFVVLRSVARLELRWVCSRRPIRHLWLRPPLPLLLRRLRRRGR